MDEHLDIEQQGTSGIADSTEHFLDICSRTTSIKHLRGFIMPILAPSQTDFKD